MSKEPDLFDWQPPQGGAAVVPFPLGRCIGKARVTASVVLRCKSQVAQQGALDRATLGLARKLRAAGIEAAKVAQQIDAFERIVRAEIDRLQRGDGGRRSPGGAL